MPAYLIADETITDPDTFEEYKRAVLPLIEQFGGRFLSRGGELDVLEMGAGWVPGRMVIIEFPSMSALKEWYNSKDYAPVREVRVRSAISTLVALDSGTAFITDSHTTGP
ncbi:DUF1330 domain-containing protein [Sinirhodobacter sp. WL0062]|uniref:DUF1330 domain-containing protein n=1 Tax=Rhodobacter flavimaris TaxID=2907145 RepID=A0ABS8YX09_9RHOB|nr:DUF1330 domain-containing protein [Sinirhodobacter sp. WL0062]MCE5972260.1 DUF1330 domain-containing protein [Sinirhodobacter sp. WL0062]